MLDQYDVFLLLLGYVLACAFADLREWRKTAEEFRALAFESTEGWGKTLETLNDVELARRDRKRAGKERTK